MDELRGGASLGAELFAGRMIGQRLDRDEPAALHHRDAAAARPALGAEGRDFFGVRHEMLRGPHSAARLPLAFSSRSALCLANIAWAAAWVIATIS